MPPESLGDGRFCHGQWILPCHHFVCDEYKDDKVGTCLHGWTCGGQGRVEGMLANEEMEVLEEGKVVIGIGTEEKE